MHRFRVSLPISQIHIFTLLAFVPLHPFHYMLYPPFALPFLHAIRPFININNSPYIRTPCNFRRAGRSVINVKVREASRISQTHLATKVHQTVQVSSSQPLLHSPSHSLSTSVPLKIK
ncbi:hypothetical protein BDR03DRAFT_961830 [Suillus americanus]|nr:hypothetical protein BDR03DRAFT_961830 [Suillus americanus]